MSRLLKKKFLVTEDLSFSALCRKILLLIIVLFCFFQSSNYAKALEGVVKFPGKKNVFVFLEIAVTPDEKQKGLMNRPSLPANRGMVFVFRPSQKVTFWMKDTLIPLDMIFVQKGKIVKIVKNAIPNQTEILYPSDSEVTEGLETNGGFVDKNGIKAGDVVAFENIPQIDYSGKSKLMVIGR